MRKLFTGIIAATIITATSLPMAAEASTESDNKVLYTDSEVVVTQNDADSFVVKDKETKENIEYEVDSKNKTAEITEENGTVTDVEFKQKEKNDTIVTDIVADGEKVGTVTVEDVETSPKLLKASSGAMKLVTTRKLSQVMINVNKLTAGMVLIALGFVDVVQYVAGAFSAYGLIQEFKGKKAYLTVKQYANKWQYRDDLYIYKDSKRTKLLKKQTGMVRRHFS
ncbi:hypothetical protein [Listeria welshimeri]|uniref:hypothetical protein n=1 Tax=Listeria welshimeri TaxID=1643 RepID=UPI0016271593|nr:hypothetical protein [Listeria welshimeri]MBC1980521.1 hypothetical protein [Listeria welshimeri]MBF2341049.1 hypothetical protein [Listeria welshimeri]MBF2352343.1 hypothetical protein [Listeria welshimeri]MBF2357600.1 hypothetical protein [Listeria welshimeri]MBF2379075.1 hypothetical protein [Listeria welshimeri]